MKNYMKQIAEMLGVEFGEEFQITTSKMKYVLYENGLFCVADDKCCDNVLINILKGYAQIKRIPWMPEYGDVYWNISRNGSVCSCIWCDDFIDILCYKLGNCYQTEKMAMHNKEKWMNFIESEEVAAWS